MFGRLHQSPNGRYLAIETHGYESSGLVVFDLTRQQFVDFDCRSRYDYTQFLLWHPTKSALYGQSGHTLIEYDIDASHCYELASPNIRDYFTEAELLSQGYVGERIDYERLLGNRWPAIISWHPDGWHFAYERNDSLYLFDMRDSTEVLIYGGNFNCSSQHFDVEWAEGDGALRPPEFGDRDIIAPLDSTILDSISSLNDSIKYTIGRSGPVSYLECRWGTGVYFSQYLFRGSATIEKFHIAELDYLLWEFALDLTPEFWFLTGHYTGGRLTDSAYAARYQAMVDDYWVALQMFRDFRYPPSLADKAEHYSDLVQLDCRFEAAIATYLVSRDRTAFADTVASLKPGMPSSFVDTIATWLEAFQLGDRSKIARVIQALHNRYFNYYGQVIAPDLESVLDTYAIEPFYDDVLGATIPKRKSRMTDSYFVWNICGRQ